MTEPTVEQILEALGNEIAWCEQNPLEEDPRFGQGFVAGLRQARNIIAYMQEELRNEQASPEPQAEGS